MRRRASRCCNVIMIEESARGLPLCRGASRGLTSTARSAPRLRSAPDATKTIRVLIRRCTHVVVAVTQTCRQDRGPRRRVWTRLDASTRMRCAARALALSGLCGVSQRPSAPSVDHPHLNACENVSRPPENAGFERKLALARRIWNAESCSPERRCSKSRARPPLSLARGRGGRAVAAEQSSDVCAGPCGAKLCTSTSTSAAVAGCLKRWRRASASRNTYGPRGRRRPRCASSLRRHPSLMQ